MFTKDTEKFHFNVTNLLSIFKAQESLKWDKNNTKATFVKTTLNCIKSSDSDLLEIYKLFNKEGYLAEEDERLLTFVQEFVEDRFQFIP